VFRERPMEILRRLCADERRTEYRTSRRWEAGNRKRSGKSKSPPTSAPGFAAMTTMVAVPIADTAQIRWPVEFADDVSELANERLTSTCAS
jgi:hypothetical protein